MDNLKLDTVYLHITSHCNLVCRYCYIGAGSVLPGEMPVSDVIRVLKGVAGLRPGKIVITGGEPLLHGGFDEISECSREICEIVPVCVNTNGTLVNDEMAALLVRCYREVRISIDGMEEPNDYLRGVGTFNKAIQAFRRVQLAGGKPIASVTVCESNLPHIPALLRYLRLSDVSDVRLTPMRHAGRAEGNLPAWDFSRLHSLLSEMLASELGIDIPVDADAAGLCNSSGYLNIMPDGWVYPCHLLTGPEYRLGNIIHEDPADIVSRRDPCRQGDSCGFTGTPATCAGYLGS